MKDEQSQFRITPWPEVQLPHPGSLGFPFVYDRNADALVADFDAAKRDIGRREPPATTETYLKLAALDPGDVDAITAFVCAHGQLDVRGDHTDYGMGMDSAFGFRADTAELDAAYERAEAAVTDSSIGDTLTDLRWAILYMRDLVAAKRAVDGDLDPAAHRWEAPFWEGMSDLDTPPWVARGPETTLQLALGVALRPFSPALRVFDAASEAHERVGGDFFGTWTVCCLELFNHMLEDAVYKTCANERCGRLFVRQEGRAAHGQHRSKGVKYCSWDCARAQAQRQYRRSLRRRSDPPSAG